jgi:hypothetical protein
MLTPSNGSSCIAAAIEEATGEIDFAVSGFVN